MQLCKLTRCVAVKWQNSTGSSRTTAFTLAGAVALLFVWLVVWYERDTFETDWEAAQKLREGMIHLADAIDEARAMQSNLFHNYTLSPERLDTQNSDDTIYVSVASFRDSECPPTVEDLFAMALNPRRLFIGIIEQNDPSDPPCMPPAYASCQGAEFCPSDNIRIRRVRPSEARGPTFGRYVAMLMYQGEKYYMMIDSHNRFAKHWDAKLIKMYSLLPSKKAVISAYPNMMLKDVREMLKAKVVRVLCNAHFVDDGFLRLDGAVFNDNCHARQQPFAAAGFLFADALLVKEVPFDPYLDYIFDGEEITYSARMWTHGWDIYSPSENIIYHLYGREKAERVWSVPNNNWWYKQRESVKRVQYILGATHPNTTVRIIPLDTTEQLITRELDKYGLGKERSIEEYWRFAKVDPVHRIAGMTFCSSLL